MNPEPESRALSDEQAFEILEYPERWPEDPDIQGHLAQLLEVHLALRGEGVAARVLEDAPPPQRIIHRFPWGLAAAATVLVAIPLTYHVAHGRELARVAQDQARIQDLALKRGQGRLWATFFQQSSTLIQDFSRHPQVCERKNTEDRTGEREIALALLQASHGLASQDAPAPEAETVRAELHAWLSELSMEDPCMDPQRAEELKEWADAHNLEDEAQRLSRMLKGAQP